MVVGSSFSSHETTGPWHYAGGRFGPAKQSHRLELFAGLAWMVTVVDFDAFDVPPDGLAILPAHDFVSWHERFGHEVFLSIFELFGLDVPSSHLCHGNPS